MNGEIYRHEVLGEVDPRPCDLKNGHCVPSKDGTGADRPGGRGRRGPAAGGVRALGVRGPSSGDSPTASCLGKADAAQGSPLSSRPHKEPGKSYL